jgi:N-acetylneuraminate synthase
MSEYIEIQGRKIGPSHPTYIIAEMSANHGGEFDRALEIVREAHSAGVDAIKLQTYTADTLTIRSSQECFQIGKGTLWEGKSLYDLYSEAFMPWDWQPRLKAEADRLGLHLFSSPFDPTAVDFLEAMNVPAYKIASFEIVDLPLVRKVASTGKPMIMSSGMATLEEIKEALKTACQAGAKHVAVLKCNSAYPAPPEEMNLKTIPYLAKELGIPIGLSDHTLGIAVPVAAVSLGACIIEKHFTLSRKMGGPDSAFSAEPQELKAMVESIRVAEKSLGKVSFGPGSREAHSRVFRRSLFVVQDMKKGDAFTKENVRSIRPAHGLHTRHFEEILGCHASRDIPKGTPLEWALVDKSTVR